MKTSVTCAVHNAPPHPKNSITGKGVHSLFHVSLDKYLHTIPLFEEFHMASLFGKTPKDSLQEILTINSVDGITTALTQVGDGKGGLSPLAVSDTKVSINDLVWPTTGAAAGKVLAVSATTNQLEWANAAPAIPYDIASAIMGKPAGAAVVMRFVAVRAFTIPAGATGSIAKTSTVATASTTFSLQKNGAAFGTMVFGAGAASGTFTVAAATSFAAGDVFTIVAPTTADATFGDCEFTIAATL
jgi:hypothetical protein